MIINKLLPISLIAIVVLLRAVVYDQNYEKLSDHTNMIILKGIFMSPLFAIPMSLIVFLMVSILIKKELTALFKPYFSTVLTWGLSGFGIAVVIIIALTAIYNSPQGPLALIMDGPLAFSAGILVGTGLWTTKIITQQENRGDRE
jgi:hypothetical protein